MNDSFLIAPSILSADFSNLQEEVESVLAVGADWIHVDVMDGHFVPNITIGAPVVKSLRASTKAILDVHLMIENPEKYISDFAKAGADYITIHVESCDDPKNLIKKIKLLGVKAGITLKPSTDLSEILDFLPDVDLALVMTVNPGFGGQSFMENQVDKIDRIRSEIKDKSLELLIEVDGGINQKTSKLCKNADILVAGSFIFGSDNYELAIQSLKGRE